MAGHVGRYALVKRIGRGGMADVWIGKVQGASGFEKVVAVKLLAPDQVDKEEYQRALTDEARIQVQLKHPNIVDVFDLNFEAENPYLVMEYVEGIELREVLKFLKGQKKTLPFSVSAFIVSEIAKALSFAHERRHPETGQPLHIIHRDVSPSNILLSVHGDVKLSDFGIAKSALQSATTQVGQIKGKFRYMSPEQAEGRTLDARSDAFSLGLVFYECLFGTPAYDDPSDVGILQKARTAQVSFPPGLDPELRNILEKLLARKIKDRYGDLRGFLRDLSDYFKKKQEGQGDREALWEYLRQLNLPRFQDVSSAKLMAEKWVPDPTAMILEETGRIVTLVDEATKTSGGTRRWAQAVVPVVLIGAVASFVWIWMNRGTEKAEVHEVERRPIVETAPVPVEAIPFRGTLMVNVEPEDAILKVHYADVTLSRPAPAVLTDIPFDTPIEVSASKKGYQTATQKLALTAQKNTESLKLTLKEVPGVLVSFNADPYAAVSIPGFISNRETPFSRSVPAGDYTVTFRHAATGKTALARLKASNGGAFLCAASMNVADAAASASASCRSR